MWSYFAGEEKKGPVSQDELLKLYNDGAITGDTLVQAEGSEEPVAFEKTLMFKSVTPPPEEEENVGFGENQVYEYKVVAQDGMTLAQHFKSTEWFEKIINDLAREGWVLDQIISPEGAFMGSLSGLKFMIFRRKVGGA